MESNQIYSCDFEIKNWSHGSTDSFGNYLSGKQIEMVYKTKWQILVSEVEVKVYFRGSDIQKFRADFEISLNGKVWQSFTFFRSEANQTNCLTAQFPELSVAPKSQRVSVRITLIKDGLALTDHQLRDIQNRYLLNGFVSDFKTEFETNSSTDFTIFVKDRDFAVHSQILSARSPVFRAMLTNDMKEKKTMKAEIHDIEPEIFETLLKFLYYCEVSEIVSMTDQEKADLLNAADLYDIKDLRQFVANNMFQYLTVDNVETALQTAYRYGITCLRNRSYEFIAENKISMIKPIYTKLNQ